MVDASVIAAIPLFQDLSREEQAAIADLAAARTFQQGEALFKPGDPRKNFLVVQSGQVHIFGLLHGEMQTLALLDAGDFAVESALVNPALTHEHYGEVVVASTLLEIDGAGFTALRNKNPVVANRIYERIIANLIERLHHANNKLGTIYVTGKIAAAYSDLDHVSDLLLATILGIIRAKHALFALFFPLEDRIVIRDAKGYKNDQEIKNLQLALGSDALLGTLYAQATDLNVTAEDYERNKQYHTPYASRNMLGTPLVVGGKVIGAILLGDKENERAFSRNNRILLDIIARQIVPLIVTAERGEEKR